MSKSIYNIPQVRTTTSTGVTPLGQLTDVQTSGVQNKQGLVFNSSIGKWTNQNIVNSYNTRSGDVTSINSDIRSLVSAYYDIVYIFTPLVSPAIANTYYTLNFGGTVIINPLNIGEHVMITARGNPITVNFTGTSFVTNSVLAGSAINPSFTLMNTTIELTCVLNGSGQTYYHITRVSQNSPNAICTLNGVKISALSELDDIPNIVLSSPSNGQALIYNGTNWINSTVTGTVASVFGRTGTITATEGDYSLTQLSDVTITTPSNGQGLVYNGTNWINAPITNGTVTSVALTVPSEFSITGSPITSNGTLAVTKANQLQNLLYASPNGSTGAPSFRSLVYADLPTLPYQNIYYNLVSSTAPTITAVANTHYVLGSGSIVTLNPLNVGEHIIITASLNPVTINLTGTSFIINWSGSGGTSNPTISLTSTSIELFCTFNSGQTYYYITSSKQSRTSIFTINGQKQSALASINDIPDILLNSPTNGQALTYNGTNWINSSITNGTVTSVALTMPSDLTVSNSPITSSGTLTVTRNSQAANLFMASPNGSAGVPTYRAITTGDLPTSNAYYNTIYTNTTSISATKNTHYIMTNGGTLTIAPMNPSEHIMITADLNAVTVSFTGTSFIINSILSGGTSNPSFILTNTTLELMCIFNGGQVYYDIVRVSQNRPGAACTLNGVKISALSELDDIPNVVLSTPSTGQSLTYDGTNWVNGGARIYNTAGLITSPKIFADQTTTNASGNFTISIASAGFTTVTSVQATAVLSGSNSSTAPVATIQTQSTTSITGLVVKSNTIIASGNGLTNAGTGIVVYVTVMGI